MTAPTIGGLFAGYGGLDMAVSAVVGGSLEWVAEIDRAPSQILAHHYPEVPNLGDVTKVDWSAVPKVDVITGGSPCQDLSHAGARRGMKAGTRSGLWASMCDAVEVIQPRLVVWENVRGAYSAPADSNVEPCAFCVGDEPGEHVLRALGRVVGDLAEIGYDATWTGLRAADVGAPHPRFRVFVVAWPAGATYAPGDARGQFDGDAVPVEGPGVEEDVSGVPLLPTPAVNDMGDDKTLEWWDEWAPRQKTADGRPSPHGKSLAIEALRMMPTPTANLGDNGGSQDPAKRRAGGHQPTIADVVEFLPGALAPEPRLLPTATASDADASGGKAPGVNVTLTDALVRGRGAVLPTPTARDAKGQNQRGDASCLPGALMPTPTRADGEGGHTRRGGDRSHEVLLGGLAQDLASNEAAYQARSWSDGTGRLENVFGDYAPAVARWEIITGRPVPDPTEPTGRDGAMRLSPRFTEWMMGLPDGWVTDVPGLSRRQQLTALGNGVVPQQAAAAIRHAFRLAAMFDGTED